MRRLAGTWMVVLGLGLAGPGCVAADGPGAAAFQQGMEALRAKEYEKARTSFATAVEREPENADYLLKLGIAQSYVRDWDGAEASYGRLLALEPESAVALHNLGNVYFRQDRYEEAVSYYERAVRVDPDYLLAVYHYGRTLRQLNRGDEAVRQLSHCLTLPAEGERERMTQVDCRFYLGSLRFRARDYAAAAELMEQVLAAQRAHTEARYHLGMAYMRLGRTEEGKQQLEIHKQLLKDQRQSGRVEKAREPEPDGG